MVLKAYIAIAALCSAVACVTTGSLTAQITPYPFAAGGFAAVNATDVDSWLDTLQGFEGPASGHVNYVDTNCASGPTCIKAVQVQVQEWTKNSQGDLAAPVDCSAYLLVTATTPIAGLNAAFQSLYNPGAQYLVAGNQSMHGHCTYHAQYTNATLALIRFNAQQNAAGNGRKLLDGGGTILDLCSNPKACDCFPGHATVHLDNGSTQVMSNLQLGDKVAVMGADGKVQFDFIYAFGHRDAASSGHFVKLEVTTMATSGTRSLMLTEGHFIKTVSGAGDVAFKRAEDVQFGDSIWATAESSADAMDLYPVTGKSIEFANGLYNPITLSGSILVDGIAASVHSEWFLDAVATRLGMVSYVPAAYQVVLSPARLLWYALGKERYIALYNLLDECLGGLDNVGIKHGASITGLGVAVASVAVMGSVMVTVKKVKRV